jgi:hypothetical protein
MSFAICSNYPTWIKRPKIGETGGNEVGNSYPPPGEVHMVVKCLKV